jgi:hypothetical protein
MIVPLVAAAPPVDCRALVLSQNSNRICYYLLQQMNHFPNLINAENSSKQV